MNRDQIRCGGRRGFTLMEVLLVLAILVILGSLAVGVFSGVQRSAMIKNAQIQVDAIDHASDLYSTTVGLYPNAIEDLSTMPGDVDQNKWAGPYLEEVPLDPWNNPYQYVNPGQRNNVGKPDIWSYGPDGQNGTDDDIGNWPTA
jgi:general secretion pathway protein G